VDIRTTVKSATHAVVKVFSPAIGAPEDTDLLDTLKSEHDEVKGLLSDLEEADTAARRRVLVQQIKAALVPHTKAEQKVLYDAIIAVRDKDVQIDGHEGYLEHELADKALQRLASIANATSPEHKAAAKVLKELVEHHIREEERNVWGDARKHFSDEQRARMNAKYLAAKSRVNVR
jgi:hemerythrin-like domain-containing protein